MHTEYESPFVTGQLVSDQPASFEESYALLEEDDASDSDMTLEEFTDTDLELSDEEEDDNELLLSPHDEMYAQHEFDMEAELEFDAPEGEWEPLDELETMEEFADADLELDDEEEQDDELFLSSRDEVYKARAFEIGSELEFDTSDDDRDSSDDLDTLDFEDMEDAESTEDIEEPIDPETEGPEEADFEEPEDEASQLSTYLGLNSVGIDQEELNDRLDQEDYDATVQLVLEAGIQDVDQLTDLVFLSEHPELIDQPELAAADELELREAIRDAVIELQTETSDFGFDVIGNALRAFGRKARAPKSQSLQRRRRKNPLRKFVCTSDDIKGIERALKQPAPADKLRRDLSLAISSAAEKVRLAAIRLRRPDRNTVNQFRNSFNVPPSFVPTWRPVGATWDRGDVVRARLRRSGKVLESGRIKYYCWGPSHRGLSWTPTSRTAHDPDEFAIYLGQGFWTDWRRGDLDSMAASLLINALVLSYKTVQYTSKRSHFANGACYALFVFNAIGETPPEHLLDRCRQSTRGSDATTKSSVDPGSKKKTQ